MIELVDYNDLYGNEPTKSKSTRRSKKAVAVEAEPTAEVATESPADAKENTEENAE
jgi:hypothetical protein